MIANQALSWLRNNWFFALIPIILGAPFWVAKISNAIRDIINNWKSIRKCVKEPIKFNSEYLKRATNLRFGFSFLYPKTWDRNSPQNIDGNTFVDPKNPEVSVFASGAHAVFCPTLEYWISEILKNASLKPGYRLIRIVESRRHIMTWDEREGKRVPGREQIEGRRLQYEYLERGKRKTILEMLTQVGDTQFAVRCEAPSDLYPAYEDLFVALLAGLWVVEG